MSHQITKQMSPLATSKRVSTRVI